MSWAAQDAEIAVIQAQFEAENQRLQYEKVQFDALIVVNLSDLADASHRLPKMPKINGCSRRRCDALLLFILVSYGLADDWHRLPRMPKINGCVKKSIDCC